MDSELARYHFCQAGTYRLPASACYHAAWLMMLCMARSSSSKAVIGTVISFGRPPRPMRLCTRRWSVTSLELQWVAQI